MKDFEKQVLEMLEQILEKQSEHDEKLSTIMNQTALNAELASVINEHNEQLEKLEFEVELIKKYIRS